MKLKGKAIFELTNVETGEKRVVKEENMITNAFKYMVQSAGIGVSGPQRLSRYSDTSGNTWYDHMGGTGYGTGNKLRRYTNGLLLFEGALEEDPDHVYVTADDPELTGAGSIIAYIGSNTQGGSYNVTESGAIENGYKYVWDFTTSQANGDIGCACLTTLMGGGLGGGAGFRTPSSSWFATLLSEQTGYSHYSTYLPPFDDYFQATSCLGRLSYIDIGRDLLIRPAEYFSFPYKGGSATSEYVQNEYDINNKVVKKKVFDRSFIYKKSIDLNVYRFPFNSFSLMDKENTTVYRKYQDTSGTYIYTGQCDFIKTVTVNMPQGLVNLIPDDIVQASIDTNYYWPTDINYDEGFMYISFIIPTKSGTGGTVLASGGKLYVWKINMHTFESSYFTITNTTGQAITYKYDYNATTNGYGRQTFINNNYTVLFAIPETLSGPVWIIDNETGSTITKMTYAADDSEYKTGLYTNHFTRNDMIYSLNSTTGTASIYVLNLKTGRVTREYSNGLNDNRVIGRTFGTKFPLMIINYSNTSSSTSGYNYAYVKLMEDPQVLMTINNLEDVVTKTSAETMKVTYIITKEAED